MKKLWIAVGVAALVAALGVAAVGTVALAEDDDDGPFNFRARFKEVLADLLDVSVEEYDAAVEQAQEQVVDEAEAEGWLTEDQAGRMRERMEEHPYAPWPGKGFREPIRRMKDRWSHAPIAIAAEVLGMEPRDLAAELCEGRSIAEVAGEKNVDTQEIVDAYVSKLEERLEQAVENGRITEKMAEALVGEAEERFPSMLEKTWEGCRPGGFRHGGFPHGDPGEDIGFPGGSDL